MKNSILADCMITAKAVKATAMANAKASLDEAFNQRFSAVFADKLREDSAAEVEETPVAAPAVAETTVAETVEPKDATPSKNDGTKIWSKDNMGSWKVGAQNQTPDTVPAAKDGGDATKGWSAKNKGGIDGTPKGVKENTTNVQETEEIAESNEDLDEIIRELEAEAAADSNMPGAEPTDSMPPTDDATPEPDATAATPEAGTPILAGTPVILTPAPEAAAPTTPEPAAQEPEAPVGAPSEPEGAMEEEIDLNELLNSLNEESKEKDEESDKCEKAEEKCEKEEKVDESANIQSQLQEAISQRDDAYKAVEYLKKQLNEINILNAKLLYTNKLFKEFNMNNDHKMKIVESFDLTKTVREVKMTYANWCGSLNFGGNLKKKATASPSLTTITEGLASKPVASTKPSNTIINEGNDLALRFKKLAGIRG